MLSHNQIKLIRSLKQKKWRQSHRLFVVEGLKGLVEFKNSNYVIKEIYTVDAKIAEQFNAILISEKQLAQISFLKTPNTVLALVEIPIDIAIDEQGLILALDHISDPGNLGTIIRLCDWFGVSHLICSENTVDCYNEKVVQASMGSLSRVQVHYLNLAEFIKQYEGQVFGTFMSGEVIYKQSLPENGLIVMGNEGQGISEEIELLTHAKVSIPQFGSGKPVESLNVATATAIILSEFRRAVY
jgi:TrmH family RNA methyltransferase